MDRSRFPRLRWRRPLRELPVGFDEVCWRSGALGKRMAFVSRMPAAYHEHQAQRYPVLYLLHGSGHDPYSVLREVRPQDHAECLSGTLLIVPDGEQGWWLDSSLRQASHYGQYVLELVSHVDRLYRTLRDRVARGICGFSMGGYGAMLMACRHPEVFGAASSLLGMLDIEQMFPDYPRLRMLLGNELSTWQSHNPTRRAASLEATRLLFSTGTGALDRSQNDAFAAALEVLSIPYRFNLYPGVHDTSFVRRHLGEHLSFHARCVP